MKTPEGKARLPFMPGSLPQFPSAEMARDYYESDDRDRMQIRSRAMLIGVILYWPFAILDSLAFPDGSAYFFVTRTAAAVLMLVGCYMHRHATSRQARELALVLYGTCAVGGVYLMAALAPAEATVYLHFCAAVSLLYGAVSFVMRHGLAVFMYGGALAIHTCSTVFSQQAPPMKALDSALIAIVLGTLVVSSFQRESLERLKAMSAADALASKGEAERARDAALDANRAKDNLLAGVSHELRTPMNAIIGFSDAMRRGVHGPVKPDEYADYIEHVHTSGELLRRSIDDLLDLSGFIAGKISWKETEFEADRAIAGAVKNCQFLAEERSVRLRINMPGEPVGLRADMVRFEQALINLVTNAIKFSDPDGLVSITRTLQPDGSLEVAVVDDGSGISAASMASITEPFAQEHKDHWMRGAGGLGLGLAIVERIMEAMDGALDLKSIESVGTVAALRIPPQRVLAPFHRETPPGSEDRAGTARFSSM